MSRAKTRRVRRAAAKKEEASNNPGLLEYLPEIYKISWEDYLLGFEEVPPDFVKTKPAEKLVTYKDIAKCMDPKYITGRSHVMITGGAGRGKTMVARRSTDEVYDQTLHQTQQEHMTFFFDMRYYEGSDIISIPEFFFMERCGKQPPEVVDIMYSAVALNPSKMLFIFHALDQLPYNFETDCPAIGHSARTTVRIILHNILNGHLFPEAKIVTIVRDHKVKHFTGELKPDHLFHVGELTEQGAEDLARRILGLDSFHCVVDLWQKFSYETCVLNRNSQILVTNVVTGAMRAIHKYATTFPMAMLNLILAAAYRQLYISPQKDKDPPVLPVINKMKKVAYYSVQLGKRSLHIGQLAKMFKLSKQDIMSTAIYHAGRIGIKFTLLDIRDHGMTHFCDHFTRDILCALYVSELPLLEYKAFVRDCIHQSRYHFVRRMLCGVMLDPEVQECAISEKLMEVSEDLEDRQEFLLESMREQYHKVKRRDLLEFFHSVHDSGRGGATILPREIDIIDLSHIHLFIHDMQAIGASLSGGIKIGYLNLEACCFSSEGLRCFSQYLFPKGAKETSKITKFNADWCPEWSEYIRGVYGMGDIVKRAEVRELSLNHSQINQEALYSLGEFLDEYGKLHTLHLRDHDLVGLGFSILGNFIIRHRVENLHLSADKMTEQQKIDLASGPKKFKKTAIPSSRDKTSGIGTIYVVK